MAIDIDIRVHGVDRLKEAKKELGIFTKDIKEAGLSSEITVETVGMPSRGDTQGMVEGMRNYASEAENARRSIEALLATQRQLSATSSHTRMVAQEQPQRARNTTTSPRTEQVAQEQPQKEYKIKDPHVTSSAKPMVSVSHPAGDAYYEGYNPDQSTKEDRKKQEQIPAATSPRTEQVAQEQASQAAMLDAAKKLEHRD